MNVPILIRHIVYDVGQVVYIALFKIFLSYKALGRDNLPSSGPVIFASNHASFLDPPIIGAGMRRRMNFIGRDNLFKNPVAAFLLTCWGTIPIKREQLDKASLRSFMDVLKRGEQLCVFPEGTRSPDENLLPGKPGVGMIVSLAGDVPVVPVYIKNGWKTLSKNHPSVRLFVPITVVFGRPMRFPKEEGESSRQRYQRITDSLMAEISKLKEGLK